jgi:hypothetical protein
VKGRSWAAQGSRVFVAIACRFPFHSWFLRVLGLINGLCSHGVVSVYKHLTLVGYRRASVASALT